MANLKHLHGIVVKVVKVVKNSKMWLVHFGLFLISYLRCHFIFYILKGSFTRPFLQYDFILKTHQIPISHSNAFSDARACLQNVIYAYKICTTESNMSMRLKHLNLFFNLGKIKIFELTKKTAIAKCALQNRTCK